MKTISQETFDLVVLENVNDFENPIEEAVTEAIKEFEAQGVQLGNIVKNPKLSEDKKKIIHDVLESLLVLKKGYTASESSDVVSNLRIVSKQCKLSLGHRVFASKHQGYDILLAIIKEAQNDDEVLCTALDAMTSLTTTNPDILNQEGVDLMVQLFSSCQSAARGESIQENLTKWCLECCIKHERNRQHLFESSVPAQLTALLSASEGRPRSAKVLCRAVRAFTLDDDIRIDFGKAHEHARILVEEHRMIELTLRMVREFMSDCDVTSELLTTLSRLCVRAEYCQQAVDKGALTVINDVLVSFPDNHVLTRQGLTLIKTISGDDRVKDEIVKMGAGPLIVAALVKHKNQPAVCEAGCSAVSMLALRVSSHAKHLVELGAGDAVVQAMKIHPDNKQIQKLGCMAVRNLVARAPENCPALIECQVEDVIHTALKNFDSDFYLKDVAKAALRDLDLEVNLVEQWRGIGKEIGR